MATLYFLFITEGPEILEQVKTLMQPENIYNFSEASCFHHTCEKVRVWLFGFRHH